MHHRQPGINLSEYVDIENPTQESQDRKYSGYKTQNSRVCQNSFRQTLFGLAVRLLAWHPSLGISLHLTSMHISVLNSSARKKLPGQNRGLQGNSVHVIFL